MKNLFLWAALLLPSILIAQISASQDSASIYKKNEVFDPRFLSQDATVYRSSNGSSGPKYWQNHADYIIHASLEEKDTTISGEVNIAYTNNSPDALKYLWLQLDQNLFKPDSRGADGSEEHTSELQS